MGYFLGFSTAGSEKEAHRIGKALVSKKLAACVNIIPRVTSFFYWEGKLCKEREVTFFIKTTGGKIREIINTIKAMNSYSVPEIIFVKIERGSEEYLDWTQEMVGKRRRKGTKIFIDNGRGKR